MTLETNRIICGDWVEVLPGLPANSAHCCITSPPYWGQRLYGFGGDPDCKHEWSQEYADSALMLCPHCGMKAPTLGMEKTPEEHIEKLVAGFREVRRVLRDNGALWVNYGDKYNGYPANVTRGGKISGKNQHARPFIESGHGPWTRNLKQGDLLLLPARLAIALQADGWWLRKDIIWAKALSFCPTYSGSTMPESLNGWRWERCRVKVETKKRTGKVCPPPSHHPGQVPHRDGSFQNPHEAKWLPCPGCPKCEKTGGWVLRRGAWRPTSGHEHLLMLTKSAKYFADMDAVREENSPAGKARIESSPGTGSGMSFGTDGQRQARLQSVGENANGRNLRDVWCINPQAYPDAHYATFPEALVEPCIKVSTSERGVCPKCGSQWARMVERNITNDKTQWPSSWDDRGFRGEKHKGAHTLNNVDSTTVGWMPTCKCGETETVPAVVLDPFCGSGTTCAVAARLKRDYVGIEINPDYIENQANFRVGEAETGVPVAEAKGGQEGLFEQWLKKSE